MILTADLHLTDNAADEYRWQCFAEMHKLLDDYPGASVVIAGDLCDRKDRHPAALVNRIVSTMQGLAGRAGGVHVLKGNHDHPQVGDPFWRFLQHINGVFWYDAPFAMAGEDGDVLMLPHSSNPARDWKGVALADYACVIMHQPSKGGRADSGFILDKDDHLPPLPRGPVYYSGDLHTPQKVGRIRYIGAPHIVRFGDMHETRMLVLGEDYKIRHKHIIRNVQKWVINTRVVDGKLDLDPLMDAQMLAGDRVHLRVRISSNDSKMWHHYRSALTEWMNTFEIRSERIEAIVEMEVAVRGSAAEVRHYEFPDEVLIAFGKINNLDADMLSSGQRFLKTAQEEKQ